MQDHHNCLFVTFKITETWEIIFSLQLWEEQDTKGTFGSQELKIICCELEFGGEDFYFFFFKIQITIPLAKSGN